MILFKILLPRDAERDLVAHPLLDAQQRVQCLCRVSALQVQGNLRPVVFAPSPL